LTPNLTEDFKTLEELHEQTRSIVAQVHRTGRPVVVTVDGKPDVVILGAAEYERRIRAANLRALLAPAEAEVRAGKARPAEEFLKEFDGGEAVPRPNRSKRRK
jgi:prevent-host-death family protein